MGDCFDPIANAGAFSSVLLKHTRKDLIVGSRGGNARSYGGAVYVVWCEFDWTVVETSWLFLYY